jgi:hypothetical protein
MGWGKALLEGAGKIIGHEIQGDSYIKCLMCKGSRKYKNKKCKYCNGTGKRKLNTC